MTLTAAKATADVPFLDLRAAHSELEWDLAEATARVVSSGRYVLGEEVERFEAEFAAYSGAEHCVGVGSGLDALRLGLAALGIGPGDEVIVPGQTFIATWLAVSAVGATPVPVDVDSLTHLIDPRRVAEAITPLTRAIVPVDLYGHPYDRDAIGAIAREHDLHVLADSAQAHGARYRGEPLGAYADASAWSFYPGKNLGALGDAGALTTDDRELADKVRRLRNYGSEEKYVHLELGLNARLDELQAAFLRVKLARLDEWNARRAAVAARYLGELHGVGLPFVDPAVDPSWHLFVVRAADRDALRRRLSARGVETVIHYPLPPQHQPAYAGTPAAAAKLPNADRAAATVLSLPIGPHLSSEQVDRVIEAVIA
jgi:dTDP-3-amino-3,4,6-trideoxy-alpha-D-glucose transaminase